MSVSVLRQHILNPLFKEKKSSHCGGILSDFLPSIKDLERHGHSKSVADPCQGPQLAICDPFLSPSTTQSETQGHFPNPTLCDYGTSLARLITQASVLRHQDPNKTKQNKAKTTTQEGE